LTENVAIEARNLVKHYPIKLGFLKTMFTKAVPYVHAVDDVSFQVPRGEIFGLVGESGCGKTTTGKLLVRLIEPTKGNVILDGVDITAISSEREMKKIRRNLQIIFQDPYESLNPRMTIYAIIAEPLRIQEVYGSEEEISNRVAELLQELELTPPEEYMYRFPHELSGGQRQRIAIARAFVLNPAFIVADEPVSMLDVSIRTEVLRLLVELIERAHSSCLYITHDIALARHICAGIGVMYLGNIVERGPVEDVTSKPLHPYTEALIAAVPVPDPTARRVSVVLKGEVPSAINPPPGCRFSTRCPHVMDICKKEPPALAEVGKDRYVACYLHSGS